MVHAPIELWHFNPRQQCSPHQRRGSLHFSIESAEFLYDLVKEMLKRVQPNCMLQVPFGTEWHHEMAVCLLEVHPTMLGQVKVVQIDEHGEQLNHAIPFYVDLFDNATLTVL